MTTTAAEKDQKLNEAHAIMAAEVEKLQTSEDWVRWLTTASRFHKYSFNNVLLMLAQGIERDMEPLSYIAGFRKWQDLKRQVRKGEKGLKIFAPVIVKRREDEEGYPGTKLVGFRLTSVFDIQQTDGEPLPAQPSFENPTGAVPEGMEDRLIAFSAEIGFPQAFGPTAKGVGGYTAPEERKIVISTRHDKADNDAPRFRVRLHEVAHAMLHAEEGLSDALLHRGVAETEAESVAFLVGKFFGIEMGTQSFHYVAGWAPDLETVTRVGQRVMTTAKKIIEALEGEED